jgi:hypothetical protein
MHKEGTCKVHKKETEYHPVFLKHWMVRESELLSSLLRSPNHPANREHIAAIMRDFHTADGFQKAIAEQEKRSTPTSEQHVLVGVLEWMHASPEAAGFGLSGTIDAEKLYTEYLCSPDLIWNKFFFRGWLPNPARYKNRNADTEKNLRARLTRVDSFLIDIDFSPAEFCHHYHNDCPETHLACMKLSNLLLEPGYQYSRAATEGESCLRPWSMKTSSSPILLQSREDRDDAELDSHHRCSRAHREGAGKRVPTMRGTQKREKRVWEDSDLSEHLASANSQH